MVASVEVTVFGVLVATNEHAVEDIFMEVLSVGDVGGVVDVGDIVCDVLGCVSVSCIQVHKTEGLVPGVEVAILSVLVSTDEHTMEDVFMKVSIVGDVCGVVDVCHIIGDVLGCIGVCGIKVHKAEGLVSGVEVSVLGIFV